jgi:hypothetical protein
MATDAGADPLPSLPSLPSAPRPQPSAPSSPGGPTLCLNCSAPLATPRPRYCGACGQETNVKPPTLGEFVQQFGGAYFATEGALWRTLALLLLKPGELTRRYLAGRRKHYVLPLRLYITISLLTLLLLRLATPIEMKAVNELPADGANFTAIEFDGGRRAGMQDGRFYCEKMPSWLCARLEERLNVDRKSFLREARLWPERFLSRWGTTMFLLVPLFAALTMLVHLRRRLRYTEHLVYALHLHSFWFLAIAIALVPLPGAGLAYLAMPVYALLAARRVYGGGWPITLVRAFAVALLYGIALAAALAVVAIWTFLLS